MNQRWSLPEGAHSYDTADKNSWITPALLYEKQCLWGKGLSPLLLGDPERHLRGGSLGWTLVDGHVRDKIILGRGHSVSRDPEAGMHREVGRTMSNLGSSKRLGRRKERGIGASPYATLSVSSSHLWLHSTIIMLPPSLRKEASQLSAASLFLLMFVHLCARLCAV